MSVRRWLLLLLSGETQLAAQQLAPDSRLDYEQLTCVILQRVDRTPEQHHQCFHQLTLEDAGLAFAQQWLVTEDHGMDEMIRQVMLEQFVHRCPPGTTHWVQCHLPTSLEQGIELAKDHLTVMPGAGELRSFSSLSL